MVSDGHASDDDGENLARYDRASADHASDFHVSDDCVSGDHPSDDLGLLSHDLNNDDQVSGYGKSDDQVMKVSVMNLSMARHNSEVM